MIDNILVLCLGNICRSPMAEGILKRELPNKTIWSAGIQALVGYPADPTSVAIMREHGMDIGAHRAQNLVEWMVKKADLILVMEAEQKRHVEKTYPISKGKVWRIGEFGNFDVADPYRQDKAAFDESFRLINVGISGLKQRIF